MLLRSYEIFIQNMDLISSRSRSNVLTPISLYPYIQYRRSLTRLRSSCLDIRCRCLMLFRISSILRICSTCLLISLSILVAKIMILCVKRCRYHKKINLKEKTIGEIDIISRFYHHHSHQRPFLAHPFQDWGSMAVVVIKFFHCQSS